MATSSHRKHILAQRDSKPKTANMGSDLTSEILDLLSERNEPLLTTDVFPTIASTLVKSALDRLGSREMVAYKTIEREESILTEEALGIAANGSHEAKVFEAVRKAVEGLKIGDLSVCMLALDGGGSKSWNVD